MPKTSHLKIQSSLSKHNIVTALEMLVSGSPWLRNTLPLKSRRGCLLLFGLGSAVNTKEEEEDLISELINDSDWPLNDSVFLV